MKKKLLKNIFTVLVVIIALCFFSNSLYAETDFITSESAISEVVQSSSTASTEESKTPDTEQISNNIGEWLVEQINLYLNEIITVVVGIIALATAVLQKTKIIPQQNEFFDQIFLILQGLSKEFNSLEKKLVESVESIEKSVGELSETTKLTVNQVNDVLTTVEELQRRQDQVSSERNALKEVMKAQEEMLNIIIQASTLAQWKKDEIGKLHEENIKRIASIPVRETRKTNE